LNMPGFEAQPSHCTDWAFAAPIPTKGQSGCGAPPTFCVLGKGRGANHSPI
jgi:hypothetical protein